MLKYWKIACERVCDLKITSPEGKRINGFDFEMRYGCIYEMPHDSCNLDDIVIVW